MLTTSLAEFAGVWKIAPANYLMLVGLGAILLIHLKLKYGLSIKKFFKLNRRIFMFSAGTVNGSASMSGATISIAQLLLVAFLAMQLSIVVPIVYGSNLVVFMILLTHLDFTQDAIGPMMVADIFMVNSMSFFGMFVRNCEFYDLSHQVNFPAAQA